MGISEVDLGDGPGRTRLHDGLDDGANALAAVGRDHPDAFGIEPGKLGFSDHISRNRSSVTLAGGAQEAVAEETR